MARVADSQVPGSIIGNGKTIRKIHRPHAVVTSPFGWSEVRSVSESKLSCESYRAASPTGFPRHRLTCPTARRCNRATMRPLASAGTNPARENAPRISSTPMAITAEIDAIGHRGRLDAAIPTRKNNIVPHSTEPPYFTSRPGNPRLNPNPRRPRPTITIARQKPMRATVGDRCRAVPLFCAALFVMESHRSPGA